MSKGLGVTSELGINPRFTPALQRAGQKPLPKREVGIGSSARCQHRLRHRPRACWARLPQTRSKIPKSHGFSSADHLLEPVLRFPSPPTPPGPAHGATKVQPRGAQPGGSGTPTICGEGRGAQREGRKAAEGVEKSPDREQREGSAAWVSLW